jgi:putative phosphoesterase
MKIAVISDIHANSWALQAVLEDISNRGVSQTYDLGDTLYGPLDPAGTYRLLQKKQIQSISGNQDRFILENKTPNPTFDYVIKSLQGTGAKLWLQTLPSTRIIEDRILLCHGTPENDSEYLLENVESRYFTYEKSDVLEAKIGSHPQDIIFCGHSHVPGVVRTGRKTIINPGSVGLPAFDDENPVYHKMESGSPMARYCIITFNGDLKSVDMIAVEYDAEAAADCAEKNNRTDWANWIRTGRA